LWRAFVISVVGCFAAIGAFGYSRGQDHFGAIVLAGDNQWYANYFLKEQEIQDTDIFYHGIGRSIGNLRQADVVFLGTSRVVFAIDWRAADEFALRRGIKLFNLSFAGVLNEEFSQLLITKWDIRPRIWVIDIYADALSNFQSSFFNPAAPAGFEAHTIAEAGIFEGYPNVVSRNLRWRAKMLFGLDEPASYRSDRTGNWYLDKWPNRLRTDMPKMDAERSDCPVPPEEVEAARDFVRRLKGPIVLTQVPSKFSCHRRAQLIASALDAPLFAPDPQGFSSTDGGSHLDSLSSVKYTREFLGWLVQTARFQQATEGQANHRH
jgi:hypothetical protein